MPSIQTDIELNDGFNDILNSIIGSINLAISAMEDMDGALGADIDISSLEGARAEIEQAAMAVNELERAMSELASPAVDVPQVGAAGPGQVINVDVDPVVPDPLDPAPQAIRPDVVPNAPPSPVDIPVEWKTDGLEVFTGSGMERFQQEAQSADAMLQRLCATQDAIAKQAYNTMIFPPEAFQNLNSMAVRIDNIRGRIQQIESNDANMGTDAANSGLEQLRTQLNQAVAEQHELNAAMAAMDVEAANEAYLRLDRTISGTERYIRDNVDGQGRFNQEMEESTSLADSFGSMMKNAVAKYATMDTVVSVIGLSDTMTQTAARLELIVDDGGSVEELQDRIFASAQNARGSYMATVDAVSKLGIQASQAFTSNEELIAFTELLNKSFVNAGASAQGADSAMLQITQSMAAGKLQGEDLNAVLENAAPIVQDIQQYLEEVQGIDASNIGELASEGAITADVLKNAMFYAADDINAKFDTMPMTWEQIWQSLMNTALVVFQPVLQRLNDLANSQAFQAFVDGAMEALATLANIVLNIFDLIGMVGGLMVDNWSWISPIIYGVIAALAVYAAYQGITAAATAVSKVSQLDWNSALRASPLMSVILLIIALVAVFYAAVAAVNHFAGTSVSATGIICGAIAAAGALILNTVIGVINGILQVVWMFIEPFIGIFEWILNVANGGFDSFGDAVKNLIGNIISWFLSLGMVVTKIIDAIFGTDWTENLGHLKDTVLSWGKNDDAITLSREAPAIDYRIGYEDAWDAGYSFGEAVDESMADFGSLSLFGAEQIPAMEDYPSGFDDAMETNGIAGDVGNIAEDTGSIKDSLDCTEEDLKYLRDIAEQEAVNRYTLAEVKVDMSGMQNSINSGDDIDGFMARLTDSVNEAVINMTEGVHA